GEQVLAMHYSAEERIHTLVTNKAQHDARTVLIAAGVGSFVPKTLPLPDVARFEGRGLHYFVKKLDVFRDRRVLIVGGGDSAVDWANMISPLARSVTLVHRRNQFRAHEDSVAKMREGPTMILTPFELRKIEGRDRVERALIFENSSGA